MPETDAFNESSPVELLAELFSNHPVWRDAARYLEEGASSDIYFASEPGSVWHLERRGDETCLLPGAAEDPDLVLRFTPEAVATLASTDGDIGDFAVRLFHLIVEAGTEAGVEIRINAKFSRLVRRGYLSLLVAGGLRVLAFGAAHGVRTLRDLRRLVDRLQPAGRAAWESAAEAGGKGPRSADGRGLRWRIRRVGREVATQHDRLREIVGAINQALDAPDPKGAARAIAQYRDALEAHFALEENVVFPALHGANPRIGDEIDALLDDHVALFAAVNRLADTASEAGTADWRARFYELRRSLGLHESREEGVVNAELRRSG